MQSTLSFPEGVHLELSNLALIGHGFGGATAISSAANDTRIKASLAMDAWLLPYMNSLDQIVVKSTPLLHLTASDYFSSQSSPEYDCKKVNTTYFDKVAKSGNQHVQQVSIAKSTHLSQTDYFMLMPFELSIISGFLWPDSIQTIADKYILLSWL